MFTRKDMAFEVSSHKGVRKLVILRDRIVKFWICEIVKIFEHLETQEMQNGGEGIKRSSE